MAASGLRLGVSVARIALVIFHAGGLKIAVLEPEVPLTLGRAPVAGLPIDDRTLSREHARFVLSGGHVRVVDLGSKNGTRWLGRRVETAALALGDRVMLGGVRVDVQALGLAGEPLDIDGEDPFRRRIDDELARARQFLRPFALLLVRAVDRRSGSPLASSGADDPWLEALRARIRPVDHIAPYGPDAAQILLPETIADDASRIARSIAEPLPGGGVRLLVGAAVYPDAGGTVDALIESSREAAYRAVVDRAVEMAPGTTSLVDREVDGAGDLVIGQTMRAVFETTRRVGPSRLPVILCGETGTGKEVLARLLHESSPRKEQRMVRVNCGAIPKDLVESTLFGHERGAFTGAVQQQKGVFEDADGGTVFLDEIGELPLPAQATLLRVLETGNFSRVGSSREIAVDVRIVAATHRDLEAMSESGAFRADLYYRLGGMVIEIPPLRERLDAIEPLAARFLQMANVANGSDVRGIAPEAMHLLRSHSWPGNVRELRNAIERAVVVARSALIGSDDLPARLRAPRAEPARASSPASAPSPQSRPSGPPPSSPRSSKEAGPVRDLVQQYEAKILREALELTDWNRTEAAEQLGMPVRTVSYRMRVLGIKKPGT